MRLTQEELYDIRNDDRDVELDLDFGVGSRNGASKRKRCNQSCAASAG